MATKNFTQFTLTEDPSTGDYVVGYNADGDDEIRFNLSHILNSQVNASNISAGLLSHERGGLEKDVSAFDGLLLISSGETSQVSAPDGDIVGTTDTQTLSGKDIDADNNSVSNLETDNFKSSAKTGSDTKVVTGTEGGNGELGQWDANGDLVSGGVSVNDAGTSTSDLWTAEKIENRIDEKTVNLYDHKGGYDASTNTPDLDVSPSGVKAGDAYKVSADGNFFTESVQQGDTLIADQDDPTQLSHWTITNENVNDATTSTKGIVELATDGENSAGVVVQGNDSRLSDSRDPNSHASNHVDGTDDIQDANDSQKGLMTSAYASKLNNIESNATADQSDAEIETAYNNRVSQVSSEERDAGTETSIRRFAPSDVKSMIDTHSGGGGGGSMDNLVDDTSPQLGGMLDVNGQDIGDGTRELISFKENTSAINHILVANSVSGVAPKIRATGDQADISLGLLGKGSGGVHVYSHLGVQNDILASGDIVLSSGNTVDGRDLSVDGVKLDGIETGADVTDANNVSGAGAVMVAQNTTSGLQFVIDEDDFSSDSDLKVPTQQSVGVYVRNNSISGLAQDSSPTLGGNLEIDQNNVTQGGNNILGFSGNNSAINYIEIENGATTNPAKLKSKGETNVDLHLETAGNGIIHLKSHTEIAGDVAITGTINGRNIATDGSKLDSVEENATADQTDGEIETAYNNQVSQISEGEKTGGTETGIRRFAPVDVKSMIDTHAMQDLVEDTTPQLGGMLDVNGNGIGDGTNVTLDFAQDSSPVNNVRITNSNSGVAVKVEAVGNEETVDLAIAAKGANGKVKVSSHLSVDDTVTVGTNATISGNLYITGDIVTSGTVDGRNLSVDGSKLDGIESGADVTDASNVSGAGAVMVAQGTTIGLNFVLDEDDMSSNSDQKVPTQQSVKSYVDANTISGVAEDASPVLGGDLKLNGNSFYESGNIILDFVGNSNAVNYLEVEHAATSEGPTIRSKGETNADFNIETAGAGIINLKSNTDVNGNITLNGTVDGRDVANDGSKLDGIESGATGDQTDSEIETAYNNRVGQVSEGEKTAGAETAARRFSPSDVKDMVETHGISIDDAPMGDIVGTTDTQTLSSKSIDADNNTISNLETDNFKSSAKTGSDTKVVTGTEGTADNFVKWDGNGDAVDSGIALNDAGTGSTDLWSAEKIENRIDEKNAGLYSHQGSYDASTNTPDLDSSPSGILKAYAYKVSVDGTFFTESVQAGDTLIADQDNPTQLSHWTVINENINDATTTSKGIVELATNGESSAGVVVQGNDSRLSDARDPNSHASSHTDGTDNIQLATTGQIGLMSVDHATKLNDIEENATADQSDAEIEAAYNNQVDRVSAGEISSGAGSSVKRFAPVDVKGMIDAHSMQTFSEDNTPELGGNLNVGNFNFVDSNENPILDFESNSNASKYLKVSNAASGQNVTIMAEGPVSGASNLSLTGKNGGEVRVETNLNARGDLSVVGNTYFDGNVIIGASQTIDGRDISVDGTKLDTIATNADVTNASSVSGAGAVMSTATNAAVFGFVVDEDNMSSNSANMLPTQQSVKAYVDTSTNNIVKSTDDDASGFSFVIDEDDFLSDTDQKVPTQQSVKAYIGSYTTNFISSLADDANGFGFVVDEDDMSSNSATKLPTQQSVKAYVDANAGSADAVTTGDSNASAWGFVVDEDNMSSDSATKLPTQQSVKAYVDTNLSGIISLPVWAKVENAYQSWEILDLKNSEILTTPDTASWKYIGTGYLDTGNSSGWNHDYADETINNYGTGAAGAMTLRLESVTAYTRVPDRSSVVLEYEDVNDNLTLNTDVIVKVSRNNGTNFTTGVMSFHEGSGIVKTAIGEFDLSSQPYESDMVVEIETTSTDKIDIRKTYIEWAVNSFQISEYTSTQKTYTDVKTSNYTAQDNDIVRVSTVSANVEITLPSSPIVGNEIEAILTADHATNTVTVNRNGENVNGGTDVDPLELYDEGDSFILKYVGGDTGWAIIAQPTRTKYNTVYIDAGAMVPKTTNGATNSFAETTTNEINYDFFAFNGATEEGVNFKTVLPESWDRGTVKAKFFWEPATGASAADGVTWGIAGVAIGNDDVLDASFGTQQNVSDTVIAVADVHKSDATSAITIGGSPALGDLLVFRVTREVADGSDDMTEDAYLLGVEIQYRETLEAITSW